MAPFYGCRDPGTKLDGVKLAPVTAKTSKTGPRHVAIVRVSLAEFVPTAELLPYLLPYLRPNSYRRYTVQCFRQ